MSAELATKIGGMLQEKMLSEGGQKLSQGGESDFQKLLTSRLEMQSEMTKEIVNSLGMSPENKVQALSADGLGISPSEVSAQQEIRTHGKAMDMLSEVNRSALQMENMMEMTTSGRKFSPPELLALQAGMHQIALNIDLTGKIVEMASSGTKQLLNTSIQ